MSRATERSYFYKSISAPFSFPHLFTLTQLSMTSKNVTDKKKGTIEETLKYQPLLDRVTISISYLTEV